MPPWKKQQQKTLDTFSPTPTTVVEMLHVIILALDKETNALTTCPVYV